MSTLRITEIFYSLQGETNTVGLPTVFVRLTGCPLRCQYCDTTYAFQGGKTLEIVEILSEVANYNCQFITVTGGEPLAQINCLELLTKLCDQNYKVSLETSGALSVKNVDSRVVKILDLKTPGSQEEKRNLYENLAHLSSHDQIKFVICDRADYEWAKQMIEKYNLTNTAQILFSPSYQQLNAAHLADWILSDKLGVRMQIQLHKYLWGEERGR